VHSSLSVQVDLFNFNHLLWVMQEWNEIQFNGVYYNPSKKGKPGELPAADTSYTFRYPRPERYAAKHSEDSCFVVLCNRCLNTGTCTMRPLIAWSKNESHQQQVLHAFITQAVYFMET